MVAFGGTVRLVDQAGNPLLSAARTAADNLSLPTAPDMLATLLAYDGATLDLLRTANPASSGSTQSATGALLAAMVTTDGASNIMLRNAGAVGDSVLGTHNLPVALYGWDPSASRWNRLRTDASFNLLVSLATLLAGEDTANSRMLVAPKNAAFSVVHNPAANTQATIAKAASGAGVKNLCTGLAVSLAAGATASGIVHAYLRDGASGAGTILWSAVLSAPANGSASICLSGLNLVGTANTAMTLELDAAGGAGTVESVALSGYTVA